MMRKDLQWRQEFRPDLTDCKFKHELILVFMFE
ncbi:unnamed protein product, partial [Trichobilharzia regenti]